MSRLRDSVRRRRGGTGSPPPQAPPPAPPVPPEPAAGTDLAGQFAELPVELAGADETRQRGVLAAARRRVSRSGAVTWHGARSAGHWMSEQVISMAPRVPVRDAATLRRQYPGKTPEELADLVIRGASRP